MAGCFGPGPHSFRPYVEARVGRRFCGRKRVGWLCWRCFIRHQRAHRDSGLYRDFAAAMLARYPDATFEFRRPPHDIIE